MACVVREECFQKPLLSPTCSRRTAVENVTNHALIVRCRSRGHMDEQDCALIRYDKGVAVS